MKIVFSYGGSILAQEGTGKNFIEKVAGMLEEFSQNHKIAVVVGGGKPARDAIKIARDNGESEAACDHIGILATRDNAQRFLDVLGDCALDVIPETLVDAKNLFGEKILVMGGTEPGHSTDAVAAILADWIKADILIKASNIDYVYDKNPKIHSNAKPIKHISPKEVVSMVAHMESGAGQYALIDLVAAKVIERAKIKTIVLDGRDLDNIKNVVAGRPFKGTTIE
ncbi:MAG TPA: UMP kinase [Candidatus Altiarchaeales archaeon]|nr:UMP kinase [Candidatus Altiarchaeales archaeon]